MKFFDRSAVRVARDLIGCYLVRKQNGKIKKYRIVETEAYEGKNDLASHASKGLTARTSIMYGPSGIFYVYLVYGMHWMLNIVTGKEGHPGAVLIRSAGEFIGPAVLTKHLGINARFNGKPARKITNLWIEDRDDIQSFKISRTPRIGVDYAGDIWSGKLYRFIGTEKEIPAVKRGR